MIYRYGIWYFEKMIMKHSRKHLTLALSPVIYVHVQVALYSSIFWVNSLGCFLVCPDYFCDTWIYFFKLASGRNPPNSAIWLVQRAGGFLRSCPLTRAESLAASFTSLFVVVNEQNRWFRTIFLLKLALLLALAREKWILLFRQKIWRENQASQPGKTLK